MGVANRLDVEDTLSRFKAMTPTSARLASLARGIFPSGVTHDSRYLEPYPIYVERAAWCSSSTR